LTDNSNCVIIRIKKIRNVKQIKYGREEILKRKRNRLKEKRREYNE